MEHLSKLYVQVITASDRLRTSDQSPIGFALGDIPVVHADTKTGRYGFRDGLAVMDANFIAGPLTRTTAAVLTVRPERPADLVVKKKLQTLNAVFIRAAMGEVACHPDDALELRRMFRNLHRLPPGPLIGA